MVVSLGPGKFYGSSLPRPRIYTDIKFNSDRVDPPAPVTDPFLSWAEEAHWSMGGLSFKRLRLQGRIEGNVNRLRKIREKEAKLQARNSPKDQKASVSSRGNGKTNDNGKRVGSVSPPPAPKVAKRRRFMALIDDDDSEEEEQEVTENIKKKKSARKLVGDFEKVATESAMNKNLKGNERVGVRTRRNNGGVGDVVMKVVEEVNRENSVEGRTSEDSGSSPVSRVRTSPRLAKQRSTN